MWGGALGNGEAKKQKKKGGVVKVVYEIYVLFCM